MHEVDVAERALSGALLGTAVADALGLPYEGLPAGDRDLEKDELSRFRLWGRRGFVSDDTQQSALIVESVRAAGHDVNLAVQRFRRALLGWFLCLPFGIGFATLRACLRIARGSTRSAVRSAGNGAAMRAAPVGVMFADDEPRRRALTRALANVTHSDARAVEGALYVAELAASCVLRPERDRGTLALEALVVVKNQQLREAIEGAVLSAGTAHEPAPLPNRGFVVHSLEIACHAFVRSGHAYLPGVRAAIRRGGDTDTNAAIVGAWLGILYGPEGLPSGLVRELAPGPFGSQHLATLARGERFGWSHAGLLSRNLALFPVVLGHGFARLVRRLVPRLGPLRGQTRVVQNGP